MPRNVYQARPYHRQRRWSGVDSSFSGDDNSEDEDTPSSSSSGYSRRRRKKRKDTTLQQIRYYQVGDLKQKKNKMVIWKGKYITILILFVLFYLIFSKTKTDFSTLPNQRMKCQVIISL